MKCTRSCLPLLILVACPLYHPCRLPFLTPLPILNFSLSPCPWHGPLQTSNSLTLGNLAVISMLCRCVPFCFAFEFLFLCPIQLEGRCKSESANDVASRSQFSKQRSLNTEPLDSSWRLAMVHDIFDAQASALSLISRCYEDAKLEAIVPDNGLSKPTKKQMEEARKQVEEAYFGKRLCKLDKRSGGRYAPGFSDDDWQKILDAVDDTQQDLYSMCHVNVCKLVRQVLYPILGGYPVRVIYRSTAVGYPLFECFDITVPVHTHSAVLGITYGMVKEALRDQWLEHLARAGWQREYADVFLGSYQSCTLANYKEESWKVFEHAEGVTGQAEDDTIIGGSLINNNVIEARLIPPLPLLDSKVGTDEGGRFTLHYSLRRDSFSPYIQQRQQRFRAQQKIYPGRGQQLFCPSISASQLSEQTSSCSS